MAGVPSQKVDVVGWSANDVCIADTQDEEVWLVHSSLDLDVPVRVWFKHESQVFHQLCQKYSLVAQGVDSCGAYTGFVKGKILRKHAVTIETSGGEDRPEEVFLVVYDGMPGGGLKATSHDEQLANPFFFQTLFQTRANWRKPQARRHCPFILVTSVYRAALEMCAKLEYDGYENIEILLIDTLHPSCRTTQSSACGTYPR